MQSISKTLLAWYQKNQRVLPWRTKAVNPYHIWLSEIMLQQTTVKTVEPYFIKFITLWPTIHNLAEEKEDIVLQEWAGLGYYARARNLYKCAQIIAFQQGGEFPNTESALLKLPGIGAYSAAAITAIAFGRKAVIVDANIRRIITRLFNIQLTIQTPLSQTRAIIHEKMATLTPAEHAGDFAQSMMDLATAICKPRKPHCHICPIKVFCCTRGKIEAKKDHTSRQACAQSLYVCGCQ